MHLTEWRRGSRGHLGLHTLLALALVVVVSSSAQAQQPEPPAIEAPEAEPTEAPPPPPAEEPLAFPEVRVELSCRQVTCGCAQPPTLREGALVFRLAEGCQATQCRCLEAEAAAEEPALPPPQLPVELSPIYQPAPAFGFTLGRGALGLRLEAGFPFLEASLAVGLHAAVDLGLGVQTHYFRSSAPYGSLKVRLFQTPDRAAAIALVLAAGYTFIADGEGHDQATTLSLGDSVFGELALQLSAGRYRHSFVAALGLRLSRVRDQLAADEGFYIYHYTSDRIFASGEAGLLSAPFVEIGYAGRVHRALSLFVTSGLTAYLTTDAYETMFRARAGLLFDIQPRSGR